MTSIYGRQSVDKGEQSLSIESQIQECKKRIPENEACMVYQDKGFTGANTNRPDFTRLINDIKSGKTNRVIVWKLDRISRSLLDFANIVSIFNQHGVTFESVTESFDTSTPIGRAMLNIIMVFAQLERETIQMRIISNYQKRAEKGFFLGGKALYGLKKVPIVIGGYKTSTYELDPTYGAVILKMFDMYANTDMSLGKLATYLKDNGYTDPKDKMWGAKKMSRLLRNPTYVKSNADIYQYYKSKSANIISPIEDFNNNGLYIYGIPDGEDSKYKFTNLKDRNVVIALHEGFIDSETWLKVQYKLEKNIALKNAGKGKHTWLSGVIKCGFCGYALTGQNTSYSVVLKCTRRNSYGDCEGGSRIHAEPIEDYVWEKIQIKAKELKDITYSQETKNNNEVNALKMQIVKIETQIENLVEALADGNGSSTRIINKKIQELDNQRNKLTNQLQAIRMETLDIDTNKILELITNDLDFEEKRQVARALIEKVFVFKHHQPPKIQWRF